MRIQFEINKFDLETGNLYIIMSGICCYGDYWESFYGSKFLHTKLRED